MTGLPQYEWVPSLGRYRNRATGRFVPEQEIRDAIDIALRRQTQRAHAFANMLRMRQMSINQWEGEMRALIKDTQLYSAAAARGGWAALDERAFGQVGQRVREQYNFLTDFANQLRAGAIPRDGRFILRAESYAQAGRRVFHQIQRDVKVEAGLDLERSILHPADHCDECVEEAALGFRPIGEMVPIGDRTCLNNCKCTVEYKRSEVVA